MSASLLSNLADNLAEGIRKFKCKNEHGNEKYETWGIKYKDCDYFLKYTHVKIDLILCRCLCFNKITEKSWKKT